MLAGIGAIRALPLEQYPDIAPPQVNIRASYPGASAETIENSVTQIIEQQLTGIDVSFTAMELNQRGGGGDFPYDDVDPLVDDIMDGLEDEGYL